MEDRNVRERKITDGERQLIKDKRIPLNLTTRNNWNSKDLINADKDAKHCNVMIAVFVTVADGAAKTVGDQSLKGCVTMRGSFGHFLLETRAQSFLLAQRLNFV